MAEKIDGHLDAKKPKTHEGCQMSQMAQHILQRKNERRRQEQDNMRFVGKLLADKSLDDVAQMTFIMIAVNVMCCTETEPREYFPVEIGMSKYTMARGVYDKFHRMVDPGPPPTGMNVICREHQERTHKIPYGMAGAVGNGQQKREQLEKCAEEILQWVGYSGSKISLFFKKPFTQLETRSEEILGSLKFILDGNENRDVILNNLVIVDVAHLQGLLHQRAECEGICLRDRKDLFSQDRSLLIEGIR